MLAHISPRPYVDVLKHFASDNWEEAGFAGDVQQRIDKGLGKRVFALRGRTPSTNCLSVPRIGRPPLGLTSKYLYFEVRLTAGRPFLLHVDVLTTQRSVVRLSLSDRFKETKRCGTVIQLPCPELAGAAGRWTVLGFDLAALLWVHEGNSSGDFDSLRGFVACSRCSIARCPVFPVSNAFSTP